MGSLKYSRLQRGMITLVMALMILLILSIIALMVAKSSIVAQRINANEFEARQASIAAQAGMQFAIPYYNANKSLGIAVLNSDPNLNNVSTTNGGRFTITYSNLTQNGVALLQIRSVGTSANGAVSRTLRQLFYGKNDAIPHIGTVGLITKSLVTLSGNVDVINTVTNKTIQSGGMITSSGSVSMTTSTGSTSDPNNVNSGANMNNTLLQNASSDQLFQNFFGTDMATMQAKADLVYPTGGNFSTTLNGVKAKIIYINGAADFASDAVIGSSTEPVIIIASGTVSIGGRVDFYGFVYSAQSISITGNAIFRGVAVAAQDFSISGSVQTIYDANVVNNLNGQWQTFVPAVGSWRDF